MGRVVETHHYDDMSDKLTISRTQDVEDTLKLNKQEFNDSNGRFDKQVFNHVARIPIVLIDDYYKKHGIYLLDGQHEKELRAFLNHSDNKFLRTKAGRI